VGALLLTITSWRSLHWRLAARCCR
jgi:hypothetical protein